jgi:hypothetical protein
MVSFITWRDKEVASSRSMGQWQGGEMDGFKLQMGSILIIDFHNCKDGYITVQKDRLYKI